MAQEGRFDSTAYSQKITMPTEKFISDRYYFPGPKLSGSTVQSVDEAAIAWRAGDVYRAWNLIGEVCHAPWVAEVLESLRMTGDGGESSVVIAEELQRDDRSQLIRSMIDNRVVEDASSVSSRDKVPPLKTSLKSLKLFLAQAPEDDAISWLRDSARHAIEKDQLGALDRPLRVALLGEFSCGKSRLINALLGEEILSTGIVPVTRTVTRIVHAQKITVTVRYVDGSKMVISPKQLRAYTDERKKEVDEPEVEEVVLGHPSPILEMVELWDTPGFNSTNQLHDQVAAQLLLEADAVLWILTPHQVGSRSESQLLKMVRRAQGKVVGVLNQCDRINGEEIEHQVSEVKKHYAEMVEEVVTTSAKWLEEKHPGGHLDQLMFHIDKIGSWSQQVRKRKVARRVAAVDAQAMAYLDLRDEEAKQIKKKHQQFVKKLKFDRKNALEEWMEAVEHHEQFNGMRRDEEDCFFEQNCSQRQPLTLAYRSLIHKELSVEGYEALIPCLHTLEEVHWHVSPQRPAPWREDFLLGWRRGIERDDSQQTDNLFHLDEVKNSSSAIWLQELAGITAQEFPSRCAGFSNKPDRRIIQHVFDRLNGIPELKEIKQWWLGINEGSLDEENSSLENIWSTRLAREINAAPSRKYQPWLQVEQEVRALVDRYRKPIHLLKKEEQRLSDLRLACNKEETRLRSQKRSESKDLNNRIHDSVAGIEKLRTTRKCIEKKEGFLNREDKSIQNKARQMLISSGVEVPIDDDMKKLIKRSRFDPAGAFMLIVVSGIALLSLNTSSNHLSQNNYAVYCIFIVLVAVCISGPMKVAENKLAKFLNDTEQYLQEQLRSNQGALAQAAGLLKKLECEKRELHGRSIEVEITKQYRDYIKSKKSIEALIDKVWLSKKAFSGELKILNKHIP